MPQTSKKLKGQIGLSLFVCPSIYPSPPPPLTPPTSPSPPRPPPPPQKKKKKKKKNIFFLIWILCEKILRFEGWRSSHTWRSNDKMVINWACQGHNLYISALLRPQLRRSWRGKLVWACCSIHPSNPPLDPTHTPNPLHTLPPQKKMFFFVEEILRFVCWRPRSYLKVKW